MVSSFSMKASSDMLHDSGTEEEKTESQMRYRKHSMERQSFPAGMHDIKFVNVQHACLPEGGMSVSIDERATNDRSQMR